IKNILVPPRAPWKKSNAFRESLRLVSAFPVLSQSFTDRLDSLEPLIVLYTRAKLHIAVRSRLWTPDPILEARRPVPSRSGCLFLGPFMTRARLGLLAVLFSICSATRIVLTNDDGWATAQIRAQYDMLWAAGYEVILSAPALDKSGTGSSSTTPTPLTTPCEFDTCPVGSPAVGSDSFDPNINYVNAYPVDAARYGIQTLSPQIFGSSPDLVISGANIGANLGLAVFFSGTIGAASEAVKEGIPSVAFSGVSGSQVSYTTLTTDPTAESTVAATIYTELITKFISVLLSDPGPILPPGISLNVNFASITSCPSASSYKFVLTRILPTLLSTDVDTCGSRKLPTETNAISQGCIATVSVFNANTKLDADSTVQAAIVIVDTAVPLDAEQ
ncbi:LOW QUALITY PROTEIN: hypothetical protein CVT26_013795, partial [Gymnopilus dilepis]